MHKLGLALPDKSPIVPSELMVKSPPLVAVPPEVVTLTGPVVAPAGTVAVTVVASTNANVVAAVPLKDTPVKQGTKLVPVIVTIAPALQTGSGLKPVTVGVAVGEKL